MFEASQRAAMRNSQVQRGIGATAFVTPSEYRRYLNLAAEQRLVSLATLTEDVVAEEIEITVAPNVIVRLPVEPLHGPSSRITTRWISICICGSRWNCISSV